MNPGPYNPTNDGPEAKAWECLRRNKAFRSRADRLGKVLTGEFIPGANPDRIPGPSYAPMVREKWLHSIQSGPARLALEFLFPAEQASGFDVETPWPQTPAIFRAGLTSIMEGVMPEVILPPPRELLGRLTSADARLKLAGWFNYARPLMAANQAVSIPAAIRDPQHRKVVIAAILKRVPQPFLKAAPRTQRGSSYLGSDTQWRAFLMAEYYEGMGASRLHARNLVALFLYEKDTYHGLTEPQRLSEQGKAAVKEIAAKYGERVGDYIRAIKEAIGSIYSPRGESSQLS